MSCIGYSSVSDSPPAGTEVKRSQVNPESLYFYFCEKDAEGFTVSIRRNYNCVEPYGDNQMVQYGGWLIGVASPKDEIYCTAYGEVESHSEIDAKVAELKKIANAKCAHRNNSWIRKLGRCYNEYLCLDCGVNFRIDSSD